ncbi:cystathionine beta-lyase [Acetobacter cerevisiae]|uniref:cystathionine beta-lyase n=1 Tax=Acetobacter cerevisiae TaxID=178900 RepID=UPI0020A064B8|nr:cystathionine beta-lyase [Acetobacter cerevisiae]MCP1269199.1 cystathionine beta-lyase [Acetobacter cerevisiae]MCP1277153.1 cystathionine beta-lyase [Acetobacter cerevisiae]
MTSDANVTRGWDKLSSTLTRLGRPEAQPEGTPVNMPVTRGSTVLFPTLNDMRHQGQKRFDHAYIYGAMGTPVQHELEKAIAVIEGGSDCQVVSSGLAACTTPLLAFLNAGDHCLLPDSVYSPTRRFAENVLKRFGVETTYYPPCASAETLTGLMQPNTRVLFSESPGSHTFEVQDVPMLARIAHAHGARLMMDNTWGFGIFAPFTHGVDVSIQALTKYPSGHSDVIAGAVTVAKAEDWHLLRDTAIQLGQLAGPDDCWLTLRGLHTMGVRLSHQARSAMQVAHWLKDRPEVARILHPAFPECPGHEIWKRDFTGAGSLFGFVLKDTFSQSTMEAMIDSLKLFGIGASWGGYESLVLPTSKGITRNFPADEAEGPSMRLQIGLESPDDLIADLEQGLSVLKAHA